MLSTTWMETHWKKEQNMKSSNTTTDELLLYAVTDRAWLGNETLYEQVEKSLKGGVTFVQLREKNLMKKVFYRKPLK